jgi:hypothetical protein
LTITYRDGELAAYQDGLLLAASREPHGSLAAWLSGPLAIGADSRGRLTWQGEIEALALYHRRLSAEEVARNVRQYRILAGREP